MNPIKSTIDALFYGIIALAIIIGGLLTFECCNNTKPVAITLPTELGEWKAYSYHSDSIGNRLHTSVYLQRIDQNDYNVTIWSSGVLIINSQFFATNTESNNIRLQQGFASDKNEMSILLTDSLIRICDYSNKPFFYERHKEQK